ncbi:unnamed protein product [Symbiodinium sp. CCMP2592]|nr:unnamed protein product [Symbiodinium sp. CCMP2592]
MLDGREGPAALRAPSHYTPGNGPESEAESFEDGRSRAVGWVGFRQLGATSLILSRCWLDLFQDAAGKTWYGERGVRQEERRRELRHMAQQGFQLAEAASCTVAGEGAACDRNTVSGAGRLGVPEFREAWPPLVWPWCSVSGGHCASERGHGLHAEAKCETMAYGTVPEVDRSQLEDEVMEVQDDSGRDQHALGVDAGRDEHEQKDAQCGRWPDPPVLLHEPENAEDEHGEAPVVKEPEPASVEGEEDLLVLRGAGPAELTMALPPAGGSSAWMLRSASNSPMRTARRASSCQDGSIAATERTPDNASGTAVNMCMSDQDETTDLTGQQGEEEEERGHERAWQ